LRRDAEQTRLKAADQKRRDDARASAFLSFNFYSAKLGNRFSRQDFDQYVQTYMSDSHQPEDVCQRGRDLLAIFEKHLAEAQPKKTEPTLNSLVTWYHDMRQQIESLPLSGDVKEVRLIDLKNRFEDLLGELTEQARP
jgi:hypothetical protein